jgi:hypothetical protein
MSYISKFYLIMVSLMIFIQAMQGGFDEDIRLESKR